MFRYYSLQKYKNRGSVQAVSGINPQNVHIIVHMALRFRNRIYATFAAEKYGQNETTDRIFYAYSPDAARHCQRRLERKEFENSEFSNPSTGTSADGGLRRRLVREEVDEGIVSLDHVDDLLGSAELDLLGATGTSEGLDPGMDDSEHIEFGYEACDPSLSERGLADYVADVLVFREDVAGGHRLVVIFFIENDAEKNGF